MRRFERSDTLSGLRTATTCTPTGRTCRRRAQRPKPSWLRVKDRHLDACAIGPGVPLKRRGPLGCHRMEQTLAGLIPLVHQRPGIRTFAWIASGSLRSAAWMATRSPDATKPAGPSTRQYRGPFVFPHRKRWLAPFCEANGDDVQTITSPTGLFQSPAWTEE